MARSRRRSDLWDVFFEVLRALFTVIHPGWSIVIAAALFAGPVAWFRFNVPNPAWQVFGYLFGCLAAFIALAAGFAGWRARAERARFFTGQVDLSRIKALSWQEFERRVADVYRNQGYCIEETGGGGADGGVDLRLYRDGVTTLVQCKQWRVYKVGVKPVRELFGVMAGEGAGGAVLMTSGVYTEEARRFAEGKPMQLIDGPQLAKLLEAVQEVLAGTAGYTAGPAADAPRTSRRAGAAAPLPSTAGCPECGSEMILRRASKGVHAGSQFWGCTHYPRCRGKRPAQQVAAVVVA